MGTYELQMVCSSVANADRFRALMTSQMAQLNLFEVLSSVSTLLNALRIDAYLATVNSIDTL